MPTNARRATDSVRCAITCLVCLLCCIAAAIASGQVARGDSRGRDEDDRITLLTRTQSLENVQLISLDESRVEVRDESGNTRVISLDECIGLFFVNAAVRRSGEGVLALNDGQRFPGKIMAGSRDTPTRVAWDHRHLYLRIGIERIAWMTFEAGAEPPSTDDSDLLVLSNGDRIEGFITEIGETVRLELEDDREIEIESERIGALRLINPDQPPAEGVSRVWTTRGSIIDASSLEFGYDKILRMVVPIAPEGDRELNLLPPYIAGILFDPAALTPLGVLQPHDLVGPPVRLRIPEPEVGEETALGLRDVTLRGPLTVRYRQPEGTSRLIAHVRLLDESSEWPDCEVVVYDDDREIFRASLDRGTPDASINVGLTGAEITIEITEGEHGPIRDSIVLERPMLVRGTDVPGR